MATWVQNLEKAVCISRCSWERYVSNYSSSSYGQIGEQTRLINQGIVVYWNEETKLIYKNLIFFLFLSFIIKVAWGENWELQTYTHTEIWSLLLCSASMGLLQGWLKHLIIATSSFFFLKTGMSQSSQLLDVSQLWGFR